jgi:hypothetical protein
MATKKPASFKFKLPKSDDFREMEEWLIRAFLLIGTLLLLGKWLYGEIAPLFGW